MDDNLVNEKLEMKEYFIAYLDILGYKEKIDNGDEELLGIINDCINHSNQTLKHFEDKNMINIKMKAFSDNLLFCTEKDYLFLYIFMCSLQIAFIANKIFIRGALCYGSLYFNNNFIYGKGLIDAHDLESKIAIFPRIVLDKSYITAGAKFEKKLRNQTVSFKTIGNILKHFVIDFDNNRYLDYLGWYKVYSRYEEKNTGIYKLEQYLEEHKNIIQENLKSKDKKILQKYNWCKKYHNDFCNDNKYNNQIIK